MDNLKKLTDSITVGGTVFPNRLVMPPLVIWKADESAEVSTAHLEHYSSRTGPGLVIVEATAVSPEGRLAKTQLGIFEDRHIDGLSRLADIIRSSGSVPGIQIHHAGGKATPEITYGLTPLVPSKSLLPPEKECREITREDIKRIIQDFIHGAERAVKAGFSYIELHGAHGYLGCQFLSPQTNERTDEYGGSLMNRQRFILELYRDVSSAVGDKVIVTYRLGAAEKDGITITEGIDTVQKLSELGMPMVNISCGHKAPEDNVPEGSSYSSLLHISAAVKSAVSIPVIGVGGIKTVEDAESALSEGMADMIAVGRGILADPQWGTKALAGEGSTINVCRDCRKCFWFTESEKCPVLAAVRS